MDKSNFITFDLNGWFDHVFCPEDKLAHPLGFRSCLYSYDNKWLLGAKALSTARQLDKTDRLIDVCDAIEYTSLPSDNENSKALPKSLWQIVKDVPEIGQSEVNLALIVPDGEFFGRLPEPGKKANLEYFYERLVNERPRDLRRSKLEIIWRSVAVLKAAQKKYHEKKHPFNQHGNVLVVSINRKVYWARLKLRDWITKQEKASDGKVFIERKLNRSFNCKEGESWFQNRLEDVKKAVSERNSCEISSIEDQTRFLEIHASGITEELQKKYRLDHRDLEHQTLITQDNKWGAISTPESIHWSNYQLPIKLINEIEEFSKDPSSLGIVIENPIGRKSTTGFEMLLRGVSGKLDVFGIYAHETVKAAHTLAQELGRDPKSPAWLDEVPAIEIKVRNSTRGEQNDSQGFDWVPIIPKGEAVPAGEFYSTKPEDQPPISLAPGIEHVHLHFKRWQDERYSGKDTGHYIKPSDHKRIVKPLARVRPLSGEARVEILEQLRDGKTQALAPTMKWSKMLSDRPEAMRSIPELYIFQANLDGWEELTPLLEKVIDYKDKEFDDPDTSELRQKIYKKTQEHWGSSTFPLGSDGQPPIFKDKNENEKAKNLIKDSTEILVDWLESYLNGRRVIAKDVVINRLHLPLTWLFTGCPDKIPSILLEAIKNPDGDYGAKLRMDKQFSAWSVYHGFGRTVNSSEGELYI